MRVIPIVLIVVLIYLPSLSNGFVEGWDDKWQVMNQYTESGGWDGLTMIFAHFHGGQYSPLNAWCYSLIHSMAGYSAWGFHLYSLLLHIGCIGLLYSILLELKVKERVVFFTTLLFAIHPLQVESVAWISASKIVLYAFFYLAALKSYLAYIDSKRLLYWWMTLFFFCCSFGGKEQAVTLPFCLLLIDWIRKRNWCQWRIWLEKLPFLLLALFFAWITLKSHESIGNGLLSGDVGYPFYQRVALSSYAYVEYIIKSIFPLHLLYLYPFPMQVGDVLPIRFWIYPIGLLLTFLTVSALRKRSALLAGILFYTLHIVLAIQIIPMSRFAIVADRYIYLASPGLFFVFVYYMDKWISEQSDRVRKFSYGLLGCYLLWLGITAYGRTKVWENTTTLKNGLIELVDSPTGNLIPLSGHPINREGIR